MNEKVRFPDTLPLTAVTVRLPTPFIVPNPLEFTLITEVLEEVHVTDVVRFLVDESLYVPVAVSCCVEPLIAPLVIESETRGTTVNTPPL